jgi:hypothetical protein
MVLATCGITGWDRAVERVVSAGTGVEVEGARGVVAVAATGGADAETTGAKMGGADDEVDAINAGAGVEGGGTDVASWNGVGAGAVGGKRSWGLDAVVDEVAAVEVDSAATGGGGTVARDRGMGRMGRDWAGRMVVDWGASGGGCVGCDMMVGAVEEVRVVVERGGEVAAGGWTGGAMVVDWDAGGAEIEGAAGAKVGGWVSGDEMAGAVGVDDMDEVAVEITDEVEEDELGQTDEPADTEGEDVSDDDGVTTVSKGGGAGTMRGNRGPYWGAGNADRDEAALAMRDEEGESSNGWDTNKEVG